MQYTSPQSCHLGNGGSVLLIAIDGLLRSVTTVGKNF